MDKNILTHTESDRLAFKQGLQIPGNILIYFMIYTFMVIYSNIIKSEVMCEGVCNAEMSIMRGSRCTFEESRFRWDPYGSRSQVWTLMSIAKATMKVDEEKFCDFCTVLKQKGEK